MGQFNGLSLPGDKVLGSLNQENVLGENGSLNLHGDRFFKFRSHIS